MGQVLQGGVGQAPARQAALFAGLDSSVESTTINKVCASGMKAVSIAAMKIQLGLAEAQVAGGMENMSQVPYYLPRSSQLPPFGNIKLDDGLIKDGLWDVYNQIHMGNCAEKTAKDHGVTREDQDNYAIQSYKRAQEAYKQGLFQEELVPVTVKGKKGDTVVSEDEGVYRLKLEKVPTLKPAFDKSGSGTVTAANSSGLSDGASALVLGNKEIAKKYGKGNKLLARIVATADAAVDPIDFPIAPSKVVPIVLERAGITKEQVKVWEFNEAFAAVIEANAKVRLEVNFGVLNIYLHDLPDSWPRYGQRQPQRWCNLSRPRIGKLGLKNFGDAVASAEEGRVRMCCHLQRRRCIDRYCGSDGGRGRVVMSDRASPTGQRWIPKKNVAITRQKQCRQLKARQSSGTKKDGWEISKMFGSCPRRT